MSTGMQTPQNILSTFAPFGPPVLSARGLPKRVLLASAQPFAREFIDAIPYPESAAQWLIGLLNLLADIVNRNEDLSRVVITKTEYQQFSAVLDDLIYGVGEDESHPLSAAMTLVGMLIKTYEDQHFPKLTDLFPELAKGIPDKTTNERAIITSTISGQTHTDFVIVFLSIGCLLWKGGKAEEAIAAYDLAIGIDPDYASIYAGRGEAKSYLNDFTGAKDGSPVGIRTRGKTREKRISALLLTNDSKNLMW